MGGEDLGKIKFIEDKKSQRNFLKASSGCEEKRSLDATQCEEKQTLLSLKVNKLHSHYVLSQREKFNDVVVEENYLSSFSIILITQFSRCPGWGTRLPLLLLSTL